MSDSYVVADAQCLCFLFKISVKLAFKIEFALEQHLAQPQRVFFEDALARSRWIGLIVGRTNAFTDDITLTDRDANASTLRIALAGINADSLSHIFGFRDG